MKQASPSEASLLTSRNPELPPYEAIINEPRLPPNEEEDDDDEHLVAKENWNDPPENVAKVLLTFLGFTCMGLTSSAIGALIPSLEHFYGLTDVEVSLVILFPISGYLSSALCNAWLHYKIGRGGVSILGILCLLINYAVSMTRPNYELLLLAFSIGGFGSGLINGSWNAWVGIFRDSHKVLGILQGSFALGGILGPGLVTLILKNDLPWNYFYVLLASITGFLFIMSIIFFSKDDAAAYKSLMSEEGDHQQDQQDVTTFDALKSKNVWMLSILLVGYNGVEAGLSDWLVTYMIRVRDADPKSIGLLSSCLWLGLTTGRVVLGFITGRFKSLKKVVAVYMMGGMTCQLIFWLFTGSNMIGAGISIFTLGIFIGPFYPSAMIMATKILPKKLHVPGICAANALAGIGATGLPVLMGTSIEYFGAYTLQPIVTIFFVVLLILWSCLPSKKRYT